MFERAQFMGKRAKHLNAGAWVGEREYILEFYKKVQKVEREKLFHTMYRFMEQPSVRAVAYPEHYPELMVDIDSVVFQHMLLGVTDCVNVKDYDCAEDQNLIYYDLGAFDGKTTLNFVLSHNPTRVFAFEPVAAHLETDYWRTIRAKHTAIVKVVDLAAWTSSGTTNFYIDKENKLSQSCTGVEEKETVESIDREHPITVHTARFVEFFIGNHSPDNYTVVKMDIEGSEYDVLEDMIATDTLRLVNELRIEWHSDRMNGDKAHYQRVEESVRAYCVKHSINILEMGH